MGVDVWVGAANSPDKPQWIAQPRSFGGFASRLSRRRQRGGALAQEFRRQCSDEGGARLVLSSERMRMAKFQAQANARHEGERREDNAGHQRRLDSPL